MLDIRMIRENTSITTDIYRNTIHNDQYLQWTSNHFVPQKWGIVSTLMHCAETLIKDEGRMRTEKDEGKSSLEELWLH